MSCLLSNQKALQEYSILEHLESMIEDYQVELVYHHRFQTYMIVRIVFATYQLHRS